MKRKEIDKSDNFCLKLEEQQFYFKQYRYKYLLPKLFCALGAQILF